MTILAKAVSIWFTAVVVRAGATIMEGWKRIQLVIVGQEIFLGRPMMIVESPHGNSNTYHLRFLNNRPDVHPFHPFHPVHPRHLHGIHSGLGPAHSAYLSEEEFFRQPLELARALCQNLLPGHCLMSQSEDVVRFHEWDVTQQFIEVLLEMMSVEFSLGDRLGRFEKGGKTGAAPWK